MLIISSDLWGMQMTNLQLPEETSQVWVCSVCYFCYIFYSSGGRGAQKSWQSYFKSVSLVGLILEVS